MSLILSGTDGLSDVDGSAATPAIRGTDANTGMFFPAADTIAFSEGGAESMRIDSDGNLLVGSTSPVVSGSNQVQTNSNFVVGNSGSYWKVTNFSATYYFNYNGTDKATINGSTGVYTALSDANKKKDFEPSTAGLDAVMALKPTLFRMIDQEDNTSKHLGFIAQDVQSVIPQAYTEQDAPDGKFIGLQDRPIIAVLVKAVQELKATVDTQATKITELEAKLETK
jgi:hypothetical protein